MSLAGGGDSSAVKNFARIALRIFIVAPKQSAGLDSRCSNPFIYGPLPCDHSIIMSIRFQLTNLIHISTFD